MRLVRGVDRAGAIRATLLIVATAAALAAALATTASSERTVAASPSLRFEVPPDHPERWFVELSGGDPRTRNLRVHALPVDDRAAGDSVSATDDLSPLLGRYESGGGVLRFVPEFPPAPGVTYIARAVGAREARFTVAAKPASSQTRVVAIYPTLDRVPANLLKLYVEFSAPMRDGEAEQRLHLLDTRGRELPRAFLHVDEELWNETHTRLTVLFDPGRLKRGLRANLEEGAPLVEGDSVHLAIDPAWRDAQGATLAAGFDRRLVIGPADRTSPDWHRWIVTAPAIGTRDAVTIHFDEPLDRALLDRWLIVTNVAGTRVSGQSSPGPDQTSWSFVPTETWRDDRYQVLIDPRLEDLAGNSLSSLFDADLTSVPREDARQVPIALPFSPRDSS